jgi:hypothetical protein
VTSSLNSNTLPAPLGSCLVVDYRLSSRTLLMEYLSRTELFETVHEPGSLALGLEMISKHEVDTCIFGPSVKSEKIQEFITTTRAIGKSAQCSFLVFQQRDRREEVEGAHAILGFPCSQPVFNSGILKALTGANGGTLPISRRTDPENGEPIALKERLLKLDFPGHPSKAAQKALKSQPPLEPWSRQLIETVVARYALLSKQLTELNPFNLKFRSDGAPTEFTSTAIQRVIDETFSDVGDIEDMPRFQESFAKLLENWIRRGTSQGRAAADYELKKELRDCLKAGGIIEPMEEL